MCFRAQAPRWQRHQLRGGAGCAPPCAPRPRPSPTLRAGVPLSRAARRARGADAIEAAAGSVEVARRGGGSAERSGAGALCGRGRDALRHGEHRHHRRENPLPQRSSWARGFAVAHASSRVHSNRSGCWSWRTTASTAWRTYATSAGCRTSSSAATRSQTSRSASLPSSAAVTRGIAL